MRSSRVLPHQMVRLAACLVVTAGATASALDLAFSFEEDLQGYGANGPGVTVTQDTIGATEGTQSMKVDIVQGATFVGALTDQLEPFIGDPPGLNVVIFDLTITEMFPEDAAFVDAGITVFGVTQPDFPDGQIDVQAQFQANQVQLQELEVGTHEIRMDLTSAVNPITFESDQSFNDIFGIEGGPQTDAIPTGFQIYINKSSDAPWTGYFDNIRVGIAPDRLPGDANEDGSVDLLDLDILGTNFGLTPAEFGQGDFNEDGTVDLLDLDILGTNFGATASAVSSVPEPSTALLAGLSLAMWAQRTGRRLKSNLG